MACGTPRTQAAAQAYFVAHGGPALDPDRLDADHDGVACENLPCPCDHGTVPAPTPPPGGAPTATTTPCSSGSLAPVTRAADRQLRGPLPARRRTPGARLSRATKTDACTPGCSSRVRNVSPPLKNTVCAEYDITAHFNGRTSIVADDAWHRWKKTARGRSSR
jgi:Excalibur calcium-binding domain